ncbi:gliding motility lipoprotein GldH [Lewinella sp. JB7]|uniref:gliding motility lipoprotein GldH n=1 Tax=Lewinella sp. JB7 TaxID=2962887 RepID=UPI0020C97F57|nr:gliding motility lipoprotein GldH [Lewinella sp. JB7]
MCLLFSSCGPEVTFREEVNFGSGHWSYTDSVAFVFPVADTTGRYDLVLSVDHGTEFAYQNFYVNLRTHLPSGEVLTQNLSLQLANTFGEWYGDCGEAECTLDIALQEGTRFTETGEHRLVVAQYSRDEPLRDVNGIGFRIVKN